MDLLKRVELARKWRRAYRRVHAELDAYSDRELLADLRLTRSEIPDIAAEAADQEVAAFVRAHPEYRRAWGWRRPGLAAHAG